MSMTVGSMEERAKVRVGAAPHGHIAYTGSGDRVWVLNSDGVSVLDGKTGRPVATIDVGGSPRHVILDDASATGYIAHEGGLAIVDARENRVVRSLAPANGGSATCLLPMLGRGRMYVLSYDGGAVTVVDTKRGEVVGSIPTGRGSVWGQPHDRSCGKLYVTNAESNDVTVIDEAAEQVIATVPVGRRPHRNAIFRERGLVYTADVDGDTVTAIGIEGDNVVATVATGANPFRLIAMEKKTGRPELWVLNRGSDQRPHGEVTIISATDHTVLGTIPVVDQPSNWLYDGPIAHVVGRSSREMAIVDSRAPAVVGTVKLSEDPDSSSFSNMVFSDSGNLFIANANDSVSVFAPAS